MPIVRFLDGTLVQFEESEIHDQVSQYVRENHPNGDHLYVELIPSETSETSQTSETSETSEIISDFCAFIYPSRVVMILNRTQGNYISTERGTQFGNVAKEMFGWYDHLSRFFPGHWATTDHIVFVPDHLHTYVSYAYAKLFL